MGIIEDANAVDGLVSEVVPEWDKPQLGQRDRRSDGVTFRRRH